MLLNDEMWLYVRVYVSIFYVAVRAYVSMVYVDVSVIVLALFNILAEINWFKILWIAYSHIFITLPRSAIYFTWKGNKMINITSFIIHKIFYLSLNITIFFSESFSF